MLTVLRLGTKNCRFGSVFKNRFVKPTGYSTLNGQSTFASLNEGNGDKMAAINLADMRKPYRATEDRFDVEDLVAKEPFAQFEDWFQTAKDHPDIVEPNAMCVASASKDGMPSSRMVLLKSYGAPTDQDLELDPEAKPGFVFFTNYDSRKGKELDENPRAALMFFWEPLQRSVRIEGSVSKTSEAFSENYFHRRPFSSQIGALVGIQGEIVASKDVLLDNEKKLTEQYNGKEVPKPNWGGYRIVPWSFEFWQGQSTRIHDRLRFRKMKCDEKIDASITIKGDDGWVIERLSP